MKWFIKILSAVVIVVALVMVGLSVIQDNPLAWLAKPNHEYGDQVNPDAPDYSEASSWAATPSSPGYTALTPSKFKLDPNNQPDADVFYVHPTGYLSAESWNDNLSDDSPANAFTSIMLATQASAFNACCDIYAPKYRQATLYSFFNDAGESGTQALDLAYGDVLAAFDYYMAIFNRGRPIILASHSQGTAHLVRLLADRFNQGPRRKQLVAAYAIGYYLPSDYLAAVVPGLSVCQGSDDIGCIIHWDTYSSTNTVQVNDMPLWYRQGWRREQREKVICINPLSWRDEPKSSSLVVDIGITHIDYISGRTPSRAPQLVEYLEAYASASCNSGRLEVMLEDDRFTTWMGPDGSLHAYDYTLFWGQIRTNANQRIAAYKLQK